MNKPKIAIIGLGYVGLPLASLFATKYDVIGYDYDISRVEALKQGIDNTSEVNSDILISILKKSKNHSPGLFVTSNIFDLEKVEYFIVTVPTPVDIKNNPDLSFLQSACTLVGKTIKKGNVVIFESTVYPGTTEEICVSILEKNSKLVYNQDFFVGYSPERINPGDKEHSIDKIVKIVSGSSPEIASKIQKLYGSVITAGTYMAPSIKVAEAAKVIENAQRDINIAFVNELAKIFNLMDIDTHAVLEAAGTKWNFLPFKPGLVGGHCIGVDPYYLAHKALEFGYHPEIILAGRRMNDSMGHYIAAEVVKLMVNNSIKIKGSNILVLGITFKENCPDVRNSLVVDMIRDLKSFGGELDIYDPWAIPAEVHKLYNLDCTNELPVSKYDVIVLAVAHREYGILDLNKMLNNEGVIYDVKGVLSIVEAKRL